MTSILRALALSAALIGPNLTQAAIVQNGSLENPLNTWVNTSANYMAVAQGSTAISGWVVANAAGPVAWAKNPAETFFASQGTYFVDLSGFGTAAGNAASLDQMLQNLIVGETYTLGVDYWGDAPLLRIDGVARNTLPAAGGGWTHISTSFQATAGQALLSVQLGGGTSGVAFIDNITVTGREAGTDPGTLPEPGGASLAGAALLALALARKGRRRR